MEPNLANLRSTRSYGLRYGSVPQVFRSMSRLRRLSSSPGQRTHPRRQGSTLLEVMVALCIVTAALAILASQLTTQAGSPRKAAAQAAIETAASTDLSWINNYAHIFLAESGPFNIPASTSTNTITKASSFTQSSTLSYEADKPDTAKDPTGTLGTTLCQSDSFTSAFLTAAESVKNSVDLLPNSIASISDSPPLSGGVKQIPLPAKEVGTSKLWRKITFQGQNDLIKISYYLTEDPFSLGFKRYAAVRIEAASWCSS